MPTLSRLELKPSPREFDLVRFKQYVEELKIFPLRAKLFVCILKNRDFEEIRRINSKDQAQADLEINQCLIEALDVALNTPEESLEEEFNYFSQKFHLPGRDNYKSPLKSKNKIYF
ncbi:MAG TPA: hypothetical protein PLP33_27725 [Leptospiraceae bacterium]|nr:hypothetical protein [Leptospiraceae bacterium]